MHGCAGRLPIGAALAATFGFNLRKHKIMKNGGPVRRDLNDVCRQYRTSIMNRITVLISKNSPVFRRAVLLLLEAEDIDVLDKSENGYSVVSLTKRLRPDVVLTDFAMPLSNGLEATWQIAREVPATKVLILSSYSDDQHVQRAVEAGAAGYVLEETAAEDLSQAIREVCKGNAFFSPPIAGALLKQWRNLYLQSISTTATALTTRQMEVVKLIADGYSTKEIAGMLSVSIKTVEKHRQALMDKLDIHEIATLTRYAVSRGVVGSNHISNWPAGPAPANRQVSEKYTSVKGVPALAPRQRSSHKLNRLLVLDDVEFANTSDGGNTLRLSP
jgi:DNA-binding NarL/FixJ family response regulator